MIIWLSPVLSYRIINKQSPQEQLNFYVAEESWLQHTSMYFNQIVLRMI